MRIYNADTGRFSTFGYGQIDFKYMPGGCRSDPRFHLIHVGLDFFLLTGCYSCNYFKERFRIACDHTRAQSSCNSPHAASIGNDDAFYIFDNISTPAVPADYPKFFSPLRLHRQWQWVRYIPLQEPVLPLGFLRKPGIFHHFCAMFSPRFRTTL